MSLSSRFLLHMWFLFAPSGLQYVVEFQNPDRSRDPQYECFMCDAQMDLRNVIAHITGFKHKQSYIVSIVLRGFCSSLDATAKRKWGCWVPTIYSALSTTPWLL